jgi:hypothetical protein
MKRGSTDPMALSRGVYDPYAPALLYDTSCVLCTQREGVTRLDGVCRRCHQLYCKPETAK